MRVRLLEKSAGISDAPVVHVDDHAVRVRDHAVRVRGHDRLPSARRTGRIRGKRVVSLSLPCARANRVLCHFRLFDSKQTDKQAYMFRDRMRTYMNVCMRIL